LKSSLYESILRPILFLAPAEEAHDFASWFFKRQSLWRLLSSRLCVKDPRLRVKLGDLELPNPIGLAAGFDKNCELAESLFGIGFGYVTLGTVTRNPRDGNPKPRIWRQPDNALINSMGLPNRGARAVAGNIPNRPHEGAIILSISGLSIEDFVGCYRQLQGLVDGVELNISTPNTVGVRIFQNPDMLRDLLKAINESKTEQQRIWVKMPPHYDTRQRENVHRLIDACIEAHVQGLTCSNTKLVDEPRASIGTGGLSGPPIFQDTLRLVADAYEYTKGKIHINACGGISSGHDAWKAFQAGASTIQLYTALAYHGPGIVSKINRELLLFMEEVGLNSVTKIVAAQIK